MNTTFHFSSANEVSNEFLETIRIAYKEKSISITIEEEIYIPLWQKEAVLKRQQMASTNPASMSDFDTMMSELKKELDDEV